MANGWTEERRARQRELIRNWKPWEQSTGPRTEEGKACSSNNALVHGFYSQSAYKELRRLRRAVRELDASLRATI